MDDNELAGIKRIYERSQATTDDYRRTWDTDYLMGVLPDLLAEMARLRTDNAALRNLVQELASIRPVAEVGVPGKSVCAACWQIFTDDGHGWFTEDSQHTPGCPIARARAFLRA